MNEREVFDKVAKHLLDQGRQARRGEQGMCCYRTGELSCAVGCLIPDDVYESKMEGMDVMGLLRLSPMLKKLFGEHEQLLVTLQKLHDRGHTYTWEKQLNTMRTTLYG